MINKIQEFVLNHKKETFIAIFAVILILIILILMLVFKGHSKNNEDLIEAKIDPKVLWLLDEPLKLPPIQFSREQRKIWEDDEIEFWYESPSEAAIEKLNKKNKNLVDNILEAAP